MKIDEKIFNPKIINRFKTLEEDFHKIHSHKYNYDLFIYSGAKIKGIIICSKHGKFEQTPTNYLSKKGCNYCAIELRAEKRIEKSRKNFIQRAKKVHGDRYDYSKTFYKGTEKECIFICKIHGEFSQLPLNHLKGKGCNRCGYISMSRKQSKIYKENFKIKASQIHNNFYEYSKFVYISNDDLGIIICPKHGEFRQRPVHHINRKQGCPKCGTELMAQKQSEEARINFKKKASLLHKNKYDYSRFNYINSSTKSVIICNECLKEFRQTAEDHLRGRGCPSCNTYSDNNSIYILKAINEFYNDKQLYKIGVTSSRLGKNRINQQSQRVFWKYEVVLHNDVICEATTLEKQIHELGLNPKLSGFDGATEMRAFDENELQKAINIIKPFIKNNSISPLKEE